MQQKDNVMISNFNPYPGFLNGATKWQCHDFISIQNDVMISDFNSYPGFLNNKKTIS